MAKQYVKPFTEMVNLNFNNDILDIGLSNASAEEPLAKQIDMIMWENEEETPYKLTDLWADDDEENGW